LQWLSDILTSRPIGISLRFRSDFRTEGASPTAAILPTTNVATYNTRIAQLPEVFLAGR